MENQKHLLLHIYSDLDPNKHEAHHPNAILVFDFGFIPFLCSSNLGLLVFYEDERSSVDVEFINFVDLWICDEHNEKIIPFCQFNFCYSFIYKISILRLYSD
jgi:hypothetical protein